ncbi:hypothetical protein BX600DRAFT_462946 [Xylariales sp. PMI_506]|nr:hypothetical protein BX600DRAFT_462946 [Xylariales sp. PMI_506]
MIYSIVITCGLALLAGSMVALIWAPTPPESPDGLYYRLQDNDVVDTWIDSQSRPLQGRTKIRGDRGTTSPH